jgi:hypothetical protein
LRFSSDQGASHYARVAAPRKRITLRRRDVGAMREALRAARETMRTPPSAHGRILARARNADDRES